MINGVGSNLPVSKIATQPVSKQLPAEPPKQLRAMDRLETAPASSLTKTMQASGDIRVDLVQSIKQQIAAGTYETETRLAQAVDRLFEELNR